MLHVFGFHHILFSLKLDKQYIDDVSHLTNVASMYKICCTE